MNFNTKKTQSSIQLTLTDTFQQQRSNSKFINMKNRLNNPLGFVSGVVLFLMTFSSHVFGQTPSYDPAPVAGIVYVCEGGEVTLTVNGTTPGEQYSMNANPPSGTQTLTATSTSLTFAPVLYSTSGAYSISLIRVSPLMFFPNQTIQVLVDPTVAVLTLSDPEGNVEAGTMISATIGTAGTGGAPGSIDEFEYSKDGGTTWLPYTPGTDITTTDYLLVDVKIKSIRRHPDGLGCYSENIYTWNIDSRVHDITGTQGSYYHIQQAIDAATTVDGDVLEIEAGTMDLPSVVNINKEITLRGQGIASTIIDISSSWFTNPSVNAFSLNDNNITLEDIYFRIVGKGQGNIIGLFQSNCTVQDNKFTGEYVYGDSEVTRATVWSANNMTGLLFNNNIIESLRQPGYLSNGSGTISNNTITTTRGWVIEGVGTMSFTGNTFGANTSHITILDVAANISGLTISNNDFSGTVVDWKIDNRAAGVLDADCNWYGSASYASVFAGIKGKVAFVPYKSSAVSMCNVGFSMPENLVLTHTQASESILVQFDVTDNDLELKPIPGLNPNVPAELAQIAALYTTLEAAVLSGNPAAIQAAALAVGDDIITEYYYMDGVNKIYLQTAGGNNLIKNKYWQEYLVRSSDTERFPDWLNNLTLVNQEEFRTSTNPLTGAVAAGWLNPVLGRDVIIKVTFIHNGAVNSIEEIVSIPPGPIENLNTGLGYPTIQAAINAANTNDRIGVATGSYTENVNATTKTISLVPGNSPGCVTITGDFTLNAMNTLEMEVDGTTACTDYDQFVINGVVTLGGATLNLVLGYVPNLGDSYTLISNDGVDPVVGQFVQGFSISQGGHVFDINYSGGDGNDVVLTKCTGGVVNLNTAKEFCSIQDAIDDNSTTGGHIISVASGTYAENIVVNKSLELRGANFGINPNTTPRVAESILLTPVTIVTGTSSSRIVAVSADNVKIDGFLIDGDNPSLTSGFLNNVGADMDIRNGIDNAVGVQNLQVTNNIIKNMVYYGVRIQSTTGLSPAVSSGHEIKMNRFMDMGTYQTVTGGWGQFGGGVLLQNSHYAQITDNVMLNVRIGVQLGNFQVANPGLFAHVIENNQIEARRLGVFYNLLRQSPWTVSGNTITGYNSTDEQALGGSWRGIRITSVGNTGMGNSLFNNNVLDGSAITIIGKEGFNVWNVTNNSKPLISGGSVTGVTTGALLTNYDSGFGNATDGAHASLSNVTINASATGILVSDNPASTTHAKVNVSVSGSDITSGGEGVKTEESVAGTTSASLVNNDITAAAVGINITGMTLSATNTLTIDNNDINLTSQIAGPNPTAGIFLSNILGTQNATITNNDITGAFYGYVGYNINTTSVTSIEGGAISGIMQGIAVVNTVGGPLAGSNIELSGIGMNGFTGTSLNPAINFHAGVYTFTAATTTPAQGITLTADGLTIDDTESPSQASGGLYLADFSGGMTNVQNIIVTNSSIINNANRGVDARGKVNLTFNGNTLTNNGHTAFGSGGNDGFSVIAQQNATINANNNFITLPATSTTKVIGFLTGLGSTNVINAHDNKLSLNGNTESGSKLARSDAGTGSIDAECNWWGTGNDLMIQALTEGNVDYTNWLTNSMDNDGVAPGFQPVPGSCNGQPVMVVIASNTPATCVSGMNGALTISVTGGTAPFMYLWSNTETTQDISMLPPGMYTVTVTDSFGSTGTATATVGLLPVENTNTNIGYATIQDAVNAANPGELIEVCSGTYLEDVLIPSGKDGLNIYSLDPANTIVSGPIGGGGATFRIEAAGVIIDGFTITREGNNLTDWNNPGLNLNGVSVQGQTASAIIQNNIITGNRTGIDINNSNGNQILTNEIDFNRTGLIFRNQTDNTVMTGNYIRDNWTAGVLFLDASGGSNSPVQSAENSNFNENFIVGNWYGDIVDRQSGGSLPAPGSNLKNFECNWYGVNLPVVSTANSSEPGYGALIPVLYGGSASNPGGAPNILGPASANIDYINWGLDADDNDMGTFGWQITPATCTGSPVEIDMVTLSPNQFCQENGSIEVVFSGGSANYSIAWSGAESGVQTGILASPYTISNLIHGSYSITITDANGSSANSAVFITNHPVRNTTLTQYYPTIQAAVDAASDGHIIDVCAGTYTETINVNKAITLQGANVGIPGNGARSTESTLLNCDITYSSGGNITLDGFRLLRTDAFAGNQLLLNAGGLNTVQHCIFERNGSATGTVVRAISTGTSGGNKVISNNRFTGDTSGGLFSGHKTWNNAVYVDQGPFATSLSGNLIENSRTGLSIDDHSNSNTVLNNTFTNNGTHISFGGAVPTAGTYVFGANNFNTSGSAIINLSNVNTNFRLDITSSSYNGTPCASLSNAQLFEMEAQMFHKERSGRKGKVVYKANNQYVNNFTVPFVKLDVIQISVAYGDPNDIINLQAGTYNQRVVIDKNDLTLQGVTTDKTLYILDGSTGVVGTGSGITLNNGITGTTIQYLTIQNFAGSGGNTTAGIRGLLSNSNTDVNNVAVLNNSNSSGIYFGGGAAIDQVSVTNCMVTDHLTGARGIVIWDGLKTNINISNNMVTNNSCCGIELQDGDASAVTVSTNTITIGTGDNAIGLTGLNPSVGANLINGNIISGGGRFGIEIKNPAGGVTVSNNMLDLVSQNTDLRDRAGIAILRRGVLGSNVDVPNGVTITGNTVNGYQQTSDSEGFGIVVEGTNHVVTGNTLTNNDVGILQQQNPSGYPGDADQNNLVDLYFGRGNSPMTCGNTISGNTFTTNGVDTRDIGVGAGIVQNNTTLEYFCSIQSSINDAQTLDGHILNVGAGTFNENVVVNKGVTVKGSGPANTIITPGVACSGTGVSLTAANAKIEDLRVTNFQTGVLVSSSNNTLTNVESVSNCNQGLELANGTTNVSVINSKLNNNTTSGFRKGTSATVNGFTMTNSEVKGNVQGCFVAKNDGAGGTFDNVTITNSDFSDNTQKGMYFEALSNATFDGILMNNSGTDVAYGFNNGIDINLKYAAYANITIQNSEFTSCGVTGTASDPENPAVLAIKARDDAPSYNANPASLSNVLLKNNLISGYRNGVRFGEFGKINAGPSGVTLEGNHLGGPYAHKSLINRTNRDINLVCNWHGTTDVLTMLAGFVNAGTGSILYNTILANGTDGNVARGFQPAAGCLCPSGNLVTNTTTNETFCSVQAAIDDADTNNGHILQVSAGTYAENIKVTKQVSILGPNALVDACSGTRNPEAIIYTSASDIDFDTDNGTLIEVLTSNVTIAGLTLDGDNPSITTGKTSTNGADIDVAEGVTRYGTGNNLVINNNIIKNLSYFGITMYDFPAAVPSAGNSISGNLIKDLGTYDNTVDLSYWGNGILLYNNQYASVVNNCMENVRGGIQTGNFHQANPGAASFQMITGNTIQARRRGIFHNLAYSNASPLTFENNTITGLVNANETVWDGVLIASMSVPSFTLNNSINGTGISNPSEGIEVWNVKNNAPATITGGNVSNVGTGIFLNNYEGYVSDGGDGAHATITNVTINATTTGVRLLDSPSSTTHGKVIASVSDCDITAGVEGIKTEETLAGTTGGTFQDNTIIAGAIGVNITGMTLSPTNTLTIDNNNIDLTSQTAGPNPTIGVLLSKILGTQNATITDNTITDAFYGYIGHNINTTPVTSIQGGSITGVMQGVAFFNTLGGPLAASNSGVSGVLMSGFTGTSANPANNIHAGVYSFTAGGTTPATGLNLAINNVTITGTGTPSQASAGIHNADFSGGAVDVQTVTVTNSVINNNANRGIDARGKVNLTMTGNTLTNNGHTAFGTGGNDGFSVIAQQNATVTAQNNFITLPATSVTEVFGLITGNGATNQIIAHNNSILLNGNTDPDTKLAQSLPGTGSINATCNWWGDMVCPADEIAGNVLVYPFLTNGTDDAPATPGFQPVAGSCNEPSITAIVTGPDLPPNVINMSSGNMYTMTICSGEEVTTSPPSVVNTNAANCSSLRVQTVYTTTLTNLPPTQTFDADYATASVAPPTSITLENHQTTAQDIVFVSTPYYDVNGNNQYDAGTDVAGGIITFTLTVQPRPSISNTVTSGVYSQVMTSGNNYAHTICHDTDITTSVPVMNTTANACGTLRIQTQYISTLPNIPSATVDVSFDDAVLAGPQTISPNNTTGTSQTITFITTPYYDVNGNMMYDAGVDVVGDVTNFVLTILPIPEGEISGTTFVIQNAPTTANVIFTGVVGTAPYTFTYHVNGGPVQSVSTIGMNNVVTVPHPNGTPGVFVYTLLSVTDANGCAGEVNPMQNTATITVISVNMLPDLSPSIARPLNASFTTGQTKEGYVQITNGGNGPTYGTTKVRLPKTIGNFNLVIDQNAVMSAGQSVVNSQCTFTELLTVWEISFDDPIPNGTNIKIGYTLTGTGMSGSNGTMTTTIVNDSGGDSNNSNNRATRRFVIN